MGQGEGFEAINQRVCARTLAGIHPAMLTVRRGCVCSRFGRDSEDIQLPIATLPVAASAPLPCAHANHRPYRH
jgi:hypothetical protein